MAKSAGRKATKAPAGTKRAPKAVRTPAKSPPARKDAAASAVPGSKKSSSNRVARVDSAAGGRAAAAKTSSPLALRPSSKVESSKPAKGSRGPRVATYSSAADDLLALQLLEELEIGPGIDIASIDLRLRNGSAVLRGTVSDPGEKESARELLLESGSVSEVLNLLQIDPDRREEDRDLARRAQECLELEPEFAEESIQVACTGRAIVLRGTVAHGRRKVMAGLLVLRHLESRALVNRLVFEIRG